MQCYRIHQIVNVVPSIECPRSYEELSLNSQAEMEPYILDKYMRCSNECMGAYGVRVMNTLLRPLKVTQL